MKFSIFRDGKCMERRGTEVAAPSQAIAGRCGFNEGKCMEGRGRQVDALLPIM